MFALETTLIVSAFVAGVLMFFAPCTLPLVPGYIAFISGFKYDQMRNAKKIYSNSVAFTLGFSFIFITFGVAVGFAGSLLQPFKTILMQVGGAAIIVLGLLMLRVVHIPWLSKLHTVRFPSIVQPGAPASAFLLGSIFATGWSPCIGPVLATVLLLASSEGTVVSGGILLAVFSLGLAIPFLLTAVFFERIQRSISNHARALTYIHTIGAVCIIAIGLLLLTDTFDMLTLYGFQFFSFFEYDRLLRFY